MISASEQRRLRAVGERIRFARESKGWTQEMASAETGLSVSSLSAWENGQYEPSSRCYLVLQEKLSRPISWFRAEELWEGGNGSSGADPGSLDS